MQDSAQTNSILEDAHRFLGESWGAIEPKACVICGSGWGRMVEEFADSASLPYDRIPGMSSTTVDGHQGHLHLCSLGEKQVLILQGRRHFYEGDGWDPVRFPVLLAHRLGVENLLLTNAAGGIRPSFEVGDMMALEDHVNFMPGNPLIGPLLSDDSPRFPDQTEVYDPDLRGLLVQSGLENGASVHEGTYLALSGPAFETPAEIRAFEKLGADAVGMSTVPEAMVANALGMKVAGLSCISNKAAGLASHKLTHQDVEEAAKIALPKMKATVLSFLSSLLG